MKKANEKVILHIESCKGCGYCEAACPRKAIILSGPLNQKGYPTPVLDEEKCTACGVCYIVCPDYVYEIVVMA